MEGNMLGMTLSYRKKDQGNELGSMQTKTEDMMTTVKRDSIMLLAGHIIELLTRQRFGETEGNTGIGKAKTDREIEGSWQEWTRID